MKCPICGNEQFQQSNILEERLIEEWELNTNEIDYINKQQGFQCSNCFCNLRSMTLADAMMKHYYFNGQFQQFCHSKYGINLRILEINEAGNLHYILKRFKHNTFAEYPLVDIQQLPYANSSFDCVIHSDTLEHVQNSLLALKECWRVLKIGGVLIYTIPIVHGRLTRRRDLLKNSYHGKQDESQGDDYKVFTEYGANFWVELIEAGFAEFTISTLEDQASLAICAKKTQRSNYKKNNILSLLLSLYRIIRKSHSNLYK